MENITTRIKIEHPHGSADDYILERVHVIPPGADWSKVPNLDEMIDNNFTGVLLSLEQFIMLTHAIGEE